MVNRHIFIWQDFSDEHEDISYQFLGSENGGSPNGFALSSRLKSLADLERVAAALKADIDKAMDEMRQKLT